MKKSLLSPQLFRQAMDALPAQVVLWRSGKNRERWQDITMLFYNEHAFQSNEGLYLNNLGRPAGELLRGLTDFDAIFHQALITGQPQQYESHYGNAEIPESDWHTYWVPLPQGYYAGFVLNIGPRVQAQKAREENVKILEALNQKLVERELQMIQLKSEIASLEHQTQNKGKI